VPVWLNSQLGSGRDLSVEDYRDAVHDKAGTITPY
jgi:hypothetical protein